LANSWCSGKEAPRMAKVKYAAMHILQLESKNPIVDWKDKHAEENEARMFFDEFGVVD
jgi:hypothetical protein